VRNRTNNKDSNVNTTTIKSPPAATTTTAPAKKRMTISNARRGIINRPPRILLYGLEKVGKTTFAKAAPSPIWLGKDQGTEHLDIVRFPQPNSWQDVLDALDDMAANGKSNGLETLVVDPVNYMEPLAIADILGNSGKSLGEFGGGFGRGIEALGDRFRRFILGLERVWDAGHGIVLLAHARVKQFDNPEGEGYKRYEIDMSDRVAGALKQWVDCIIFAQREAFARTEKNKTRGAGSGARMMHTEWRPAYDAGNRWGLESEIPLSWADLMAAKASGVARRETLLKQINEHLAELADPAVSAKVEGYIAEGADIFEIANAVSAKLGAAREARAGQGGNSSGAAEDATQDGGASDGTQANNTQAA